MDYIQTLPLENRCLYEHFQYDKNKPAWNKPVRLTFDLEQEPSIPDTALLDTLKSAIIEKAEKNGFRIKCKRKIII